MKFRPAVAVLALVLLLGSVPRAVAVDVRARSAILMEAGSGRVLYEKNAHDRRLIASTTKLMTALVALESGVELSREITISPMGVGGSGSPSSLGGGEKLTLETLLYGMLLHSGNDAALAVAEVCAGSEEAFAAGMNRKAAELGMKDSHFTNPSGLNDEEHYSTAYDLALLARACLENETVGKIVATKSISLGERTFTNHNKLLWRYEGCIGLKTGYTEKAGRTLVSAAEREGMTLICVTLSDPNDWADHAALFDQGFAALEGRTLVYPGERMGWMPVEGGLVPLCPLVAGERLYVPLKAGEEPEVEVLPDRDALAAPCPEGQQVGEIRCLLNGEELGRVPLVTGRAVPCDLAPEGNLLTEFLARLAAL